MPITRKESAVSVFHHSERSKPVVLQLLDPFGVVERFGFSAQRHRLEKIASENQLTKPVERIVAGFSRLSTDRFLANGLKHGSNASVAAVRHLITFPAANGIPLSYGCSECHWKYLPIHNGIDPNSHVLREIGSLQTQIAFDSHNCNYFKTSQPKSPNDSR
jgi:hypothetical protein